MDMPQTTSRPDVDIEEDIDQLIRSYSPLKASRPYFTYKAADGVVVLTGNVRSPQARRVLLDNIPHINGVKSIQSDALHDDETIRLAVGPILPNGVYANVHFGAVALTGSLPNGATADGLIRAAGAVAGVRRVGAEFGETSRSGATPAL